MTMPSILPTLLIWKHIWRGSEIKNTKQQQRKKKTHPQTVQSDTANGYKHLILQAAELRNIYNNLENIVPHRIKVKKLPYHFINH